MIDLGVVGADDYEPEPPARGRRQRFGVRAVVAALVVVLAGAVAGVAPAGRLPAVHRIGPLRDGPSPNQIIGDILIDMDPSAGVIRAFELDGGGLRWQATFEPGLWPSTQPAGEIILLSLQEDVPFGGESGQVGIRSAGIRAINVRTGRQMWQHDGAAASDAAGGVLAVIGPGARIAGVDVVTGAERWHRESTGVARTVAGTFGPEDGHAGEVTMATSDGLVIAVDAMTGAVRRQTRVRPGVFDAYVWQDLVGVNYYTGRGTAQEFVVYRFGQTVPLWRKPLPPDSGGLWPCTATTLCLHSQWSAEHLDPRTGKVVPTPPEPVVVLEPTPGTDGWDWIGELRGRMLAVWFAPTRSAWLGFRATDGARPLMPLPEGLRYCRLDEKWLLCFDKEQPLNAYAIRVADIEGLLDELT